jgi:hypothetical protein
VRNVASEGEEVEEVKEKNTALLDCQIWGRRERLKSERSCGARKRKRPGGKPGRFSKHGDAEHEERFLVAQKTRSLGMTPKASNSREPGAAEAAAPRRGHALL